MKRIFIFASFLWLMSCNGKARQKVVGVQNDTQSIEFFAKQQFGDRYAIIENESKTHVIILQKRKQLNDLFPSIHFFIFDKLSQKSIYEDDISMGTVSWISNFEIQVIERLAKTKEYKSQKIIYRYDILKKQKVME